MRHFRSLHLLISVFSLSFILTLGGCLSKDGGGGSPESNSSLSPVPGQGPLGNGEAYGVFRSTSYYNLVPGETCLDVNGFKLPTWRSQILIRTPIGSVGTTTAELGGDRCGSKALESVPVSSIEVASYDPNHITYKENILEYRETSEDGTVNLDDYTVVLCDLENSTPQSGARLAIRYGKYSDNPSARFYQDPGTTLPIKSYLLKDEHPVNRTIMGWDAVPPAFPSLSYWNTDYTLTIDLDPSHSSDPYRFSAKIDSWTDKPHQTKWLCRIHDDQPSVSGTSGFQSVRLINGRLEPTSNYFKIPRNHLCQANGKNKYTYEKKLHRDGNVYSLTGNGCTAAPMALPVLEKYFANALYIMGDGEIYEYFAMESGPAIFRDQRRFTSLLCVQPNTYGYGELSLVVDNQYPLDPNSRNFLKIYAAPLSTLEGFFPRLSHVDSGRVKLSTAITDTTVTHSASPRWDNMTLSMSLSVTRTLNGKTDAGGTPGALTIVKPGVPVNEVSIPIRCYTDLGNDPYVAGR